MPENDGPELLRTPQSRPSNPNGSRWHCLFKNVSFSAGNLIMFVIGFCLYSSIMLIPLFLQTLIGYSATDAGMFNLLRNIGGSVGIAMAATLLARYQPFYQTGLVANVNHHRPGLFNHHATLVASETAPDQQGNTGEH